MIDKLQHMPILQCSLEKIADARLRKLGYANGFSLYNCMHNFGRRLYIKNAEFVKIAQGLVALQQLLRG